MTGRIWMLAMFALCSSFPARADGLSACRLSGIEGPAKCGVVQVLENPAPGNRIA